MTRTVFLDGHILAGDQRGLGGLGFLGDVAKGEMVVVVVICVVVGLALVVDEAVLGDDGCVCSGCADDGSDDVEIDAVCGEIKVGAGRG